MQNNFNAAHPFIARQISASAVASVAASTVRIKTEGKPTLIELKALMKEYNTNQPDEARRFKNIDKNSLGIAKEKWDSRSPIFSENSEPLLMGVAVAKRKNKIKI